MGNLTVKESGEMVNIISPNVNNITSFKVHFSPKQEGTGNPSPENVREIVGWNGVEGYKCGKNLFDYVHANILDKHIKNDSGVSVSDGGNSYCQIYISVMPNTTYTLSGLSNEKLFAKRIYYYDKDKQWISRTNGSTKTSFTITTPSNCRYIQIQSERQEYQDWSTVQVELGNTATKFEPYKYGTVLMDWTDTIGNIYGGYVDLITGELVATQKLLTITGNEDVTYRVFQDSIYTGSTLFLSDSEEIASPSMSIIGVCSFASTNDGIVNRDYLRKAYSDRGLQFYKVSEYWGLSEVTSEALVNKLQAWNSLGTPLQICYSLADPITIATLSPTQLSTLKGQNNFWSNADYVEIEYELTETFDIQKAKRKIILNQPHVESTSGTIAKPETDMIGKIKECKIHFMPVQQGDSDPTPDNIVPVTGWTGIDVYSTGKNLFNLNVPVGLPSSTAGTNTTKRIFTPYTVIKGTSGTNYYNPGSVNSYSINDDILTVNSRSGYGVGFAIKIKPNQTYTISGLADNEYGSVGISTYSKDGKFTKTREVSRFINYPYFSFNTNSQADILVLTFFAPNGGYNIDIHFSNIQLETGNTVTEYESFKGNVMSVNWENEIGTIYGGYVDLISGELVVTQIIIKDKWGNWEQSGVLDNHVRKTHDFQYTVKGGSASQYCLSNVTSNYVWSNSQDTVHYYVSSTGRLAYMILPTDFDENTEVEVVGTLVEPITYQLTPQQLTTLRGINNIWSSANGEVEIKYWKH